MKNIIVFSFIICVFFNSAKLLAQDYSEYFKSIALAEMNILDSNYVEAIKIYKTTFKSYDFILPKDAYIAAQVGAYNQDENSCLYFLIEGIKNGLPRESIVNNPHLAKWSIQPTAKILTNNFVDSLSNFNESRYDKKYRDTIIVMIKEDQKLRDKNETFLNAVVFNHKLKPKLYKKWMKQAEEQSNAIVHFVKTIGFPSHKTIGTHRRIDYDKFGTDYGSNYATIILFHYDFAFQILEDLLPKQLKSGNITPKQYALLRDFATRHLMFGKVEDLVYQDYKYFIRWTDNKTKISKTERINRDNWIKDNLVQINKDRFEIGLIPYEYQNKMKINQRLYNKNYEILKNKKLPYFDFNFWGWD